VQRWMQLPSCPEAPAALTPRRICCTASHSAHRVPPAATLLPAGILQNMKSPGKNPLPSPPPKVSTCAPPACPHPLRGTGGEVGQHERETPHKQARQLIDDADLLKDDACVRVGCVRA
jgi:crotonobetainyl-CoA:carnitine CoA-transferase CaiB-like acyl-CoA transferase